jgi:putative hydrolase of the HAD superfamily
MTVRAVLFDLGDTLWHFPEMPPAMTIRTETMKRVSGTLISWGVPFEGEFRFLGRDIRLGVEKADRAAYESDCVSPDFNEVVRQIVADKGLQVSYEQAAQLWDAWNLGGAMLGRTIFDDAYRTLDWLRERGIRIGCVTNRVFGGPRFVEELKELRLDEYFESVAVSCDMGYMKPHPKIFEHVLEEMKIDPAETAMVGDSLRADVQASQSLGMTAIWRRIRKPDPPHEAEQLGEATDDDTRASGGSRAGAGRGVGPHSDPDEDTTKAATRAQTGRALGNYQEGEGITPDHEIWNLWELTELPVYG